MSDLLSLDLTSALRTAVELNTPKNRNSYSSDFKNKSGAGVSQVGSASESFSSSSNNTEALADKVSLSGGNGVLSFATAGLAANNPTAQAQNVTVSYDAKAVSVSGADMGMRSSFLIIA